MTDLKLGINNCFAVKRWSQPEQWLDIIVDELHLAECQFSLDLVPVSANSAHWLPHAEAVRRAADRRGVAIHSTFTGLGVYGANLLMSDDEGDRTHAELWYRAVIDATAAMGAGYTGGHVGAMSVPTFRDAQARIQRRGQLIEAMHRLADYASQQGLKALTFENSAVAREYGHDIDEAHALEEALADTAIPWALCLDLGHPASLTTGTSSDDPVAWLTESWRTTPILQLQQTNRGADRHGPFTAESNTSGLVRREPVLAAVAERQDETAIAAFLEIIPPHEADDDQVLADLVDSVEYWRQALPATA